MLALYSTVNVMYCFPLPLFTSNIAILATFTTLKLIPVCSEVGNFRWNYCKETFRSQVVVQHDPLSNHMRCVKNCSLNLEHAIKMMKDQKLRMYILINLKFKKRVIVGYI